MTPETTAVETTEIFTIRGMVDERTLTKSVGSLDNENEYTTWQEWRAADGEIVKRDVQVRLKRGMAALSEAGAFS